MAEIYLLAGAPAVGKSSTARALAAHFPKSIHIPVDDVRHMVISGLVEPGEGEADLSEQLHLARRSVTQMALTYRSAGFVVVIDDFWDPNSRLEEYDALLGEPDFRQILLYPDQQAAEARLLKREGLGEGREYLAGGIRWVYEHLSAEITQLPQRGWRVIDTTNRNIPETVEAILTRTQS